MKLTRKKLNEDGVAHLLLLVVVVVVAIGGVGTLVVVRQSKSQKDSKSVVQATDQQQEVKTNQTAQKAEETPVATIPAAQTQTPPETQTQAAPKITHPTDATCSTGKTITVYASVSSGTPVYKQNYADPQLLAKKTVYGSSITASCYGGGWMEYRVGEQPYYVNFADVSTTKP